MSGHSNGAAPREPLAAPVLERRFSERAKAELAEIVSHYPEERGAMLPALWMAQREYGGTITPSAIAEVAELLHRPYAEVQGVASFYTMYNLRRVGRFHIEVCTCLTCACVGAYDVLHRFEELLGIEAGETTSDGEFTLAEVECLNWCEAGTVVQVGERYFGSVTAAAVEGLLAELKQGDVCTTTSHADVIVKIHLPAHKNLSASGANG